MPCSKPLSAIRLSDGSVKIISDRDSLLYSHHRLKGQFKEMFFVPCGKCHDCRCNRTRQWAMRCMHEASLHSANIFGTFTYDNSTVHRTEKAHQTLYKLDFVRYIKNVRRDFGAGIRYFQCGEYGQSCQVCEKSRQLCECERYIPGLGRPHHHAALFNLTYDDAEFLKCEQGNSLYTSKKMSEHWPHGICTFGKLTYESAAYVAGYVQKKIYGPLADSHYDGREPEYVSMSLRPGIAHDFVQKYYQDCYPDDHISFRGELLHPPRYYDKLYSRLDPESLETIKIERAEYVKQSHAYDRDQIQQRQHAAIYKQRRVNRDKITEGLL